jgi:hypothetical protein
MNDNNTLLLSIGYAVEEREGEFRNFFGLQISVLDARNPAQPTVAQQYVVKRNSSESYVETNAVSDFRSVRYDPQTQRLILPVSILRYQYWMPNDHGFRVFIVNENEITPTCRIDMVVNTSYNDCYYCASLPFRSMIFRGNIMMMVAHFVTSISLRSCTSEWNLTVSPPADPNDCCDAFFGAGLSPT